MVCTEFREQVISAVAIDMEPLRPTIKKRSVPWSCCEPGKMPRENAACGECFHLEATLFRCLYHLVRSLLAPCMDLQGSCADASLDAEFAGQCCRVAHDL